MATKNATIKQLRKELCDKYRIMNIDMELCPYRDFGNGFDLEISDVSHTARKCPATLYLWFTGEKSSPLIVKTVHDVERSAEAIHAAAEELYELYESLIKHGITDRDALYEMFYK